MIAKFSSSVQKLCHAKFQPNFDFASFYLSEMCILHFHISTKYFSHAECRE